ncbi:hypothetical protein AAC387_Pa08g2191 [Persea americana]
MSKEGDLKKVDLKVSVNCCEGCKKKVKKALQSIDGVYKVQIDSYQPKVTITGNVDAQTLIKKLTKISKTAEVWPSGSQKSSKDEKKIDNGNKEGENCSKNVKDKAKDTDNGKKPDNKECKCSNSCAHFKSNGSDICNTGGNNTEEKEDTQGAEIGKTNSGSTPEVPKHVFPVPQPGIVHEAGSVGSFAPYCYAIEPSTIHPMYYPVGAYLAPPPVYYYELPVSQRPVQLTAPRLTDYFDDDNTVGCAVM